MKMFSLLFGLWEFLFRKEELHVLILGEVLLCHVHVCISQSFGLQCIRRKRRGAKLPLPWHVHRHRQGRQDNAA